ncbi:unnamed protein product [Cylicocyclus nassatus]|uniref:Uncharacterized protein n=1 Tax=Cylicocyclus nassatus TaxID=53992 RepID=A0AA36MEU2_CYLNA|nr:unnamed protein product [Cylicocyclus nassatus]
MISGFRSAQIVCESIVQLLLSNSKYGGMFRFVPAAVVFIALVALESSTALKCWKWHLQTTPYRVSDIGEDLHPQCIFILDAPCLTKIIAHSCMTTFTFFNLAHNTCYVDEAGFVKCVCDTDFCSSNCTYVVKLWKESEAYRDYNDTNKGSCMRAYERACKLGKIRLPVAGENIQNDPIEVDEGVNEVL